MCADKRDLWPADDLSLITVRAPLRDEQDGSRKTKRTERKEQSESRIDNQPNFQEMTTVQQADSGESEQD